MSLIILRLSTALALSSVTLFGQTELQLRPPDASSKHLTITLSTAPTTATGGAKVLLLADVVPKPKIHVYAPGANDYIPITLKLEPPAGVTTGKLTYPKSETLFFEPLNEHVPVFEKPFRLTQEVTLDRSVTTGPVTVAGTVNYQACDDKVCFAPVKLPVRWTIPIK